MLPEELGLFLALMLILGVGYCLGRAHAYWIEEGRPEDEEKDETL